MYMDRNQPPVPDLDDVPDGTLLWQYYDIEYAKDQPPPDGPCWWGLSLWVGHLDLATAVRRVRQRRVIPAIDRVRHTTAGDLRKARFCVYFSNWDEHVTVMCKDAAVPWDDSAREAFRQAFTSPTGDAP
jgi:hypothetical protein